MVSIEDQARFGVGLQWRFDLLEEQAERQFFAFQVSVDDIVAKVLEVLGQVGQSVGDTYLLNRYWR